VCVFLKVQKYDFFRKKVPCVDIFFYFFSGAHKKSPPQGIRGGTNLKLYYEKENINEVTE